MRWVGGRGGGDSVGCDVLIQVTCADTQSLDVLASHYATCTAAAGTSNQMRCLFLSSAIVSTGKLIIPPTSFLSGQTEIIHAWVIKTTRSKLSAILHIVELSMCKRIGTQHPCSCIVKLNERFYDATWHACDILHVR